MELGRSFQPKRTKNRIRIFWAGSKGKCNYKTKQTKTDIKANKWPHLQFSLCLEPQFLDFFSQLDKPLLQKKKACLWLSAYLEAQDCRLSKMNELKSTRAHSILKKISECKGIISQLNSGDITLDKIAPHLLLTEFEAYCMIGAGEAKEFLLKSLSRFLNPSDFWLQASGFRTFLRSLFRFNPILSKPNNQPNLEFLFSYCHGKLTIGFGRFFF